MEYFAYFATLLIITTLICSTKRGVSVLKLFGKKTAKNRFDRWIGDYQGVLYKHALWMTGNQDMAREMVQEAFFQAWLAIDSLKNTDKPLPWLLTILRRAIYREQRCQYRQIETVAQLSVLDEERSQNDAFQLLNIYSALESVSVNHREVFLLFHLHGFSYDEISEQLQIPRGTVMSRLARAREALHELQQTTGENKVIDLGVIKQRKANDER